MNDLFIMKIVDFSHSILPCMVNAASSTSGPDGQSNLPVRISSLSCNTCLLYTSRCV